MTLLLVSSVGVLMTLLGATPAEGQDAAEIFPDGYRPVPGGWRICLKGQVPARLHRRPLYPPADKSFIWDEAQRKAMAHCGFRPLVVAYIEPRFLFDAHAAGGLMGHLFMGLSLKDGPSKWFHQWDELDVSCVEGRMEYLLHDPAFPGITVTLQAMAMGDSVGVLVKTRVDGLAGPADLVWAYGGASSFFTNYAMDAREFAFSPDQCAKDRVCWSGNRFQVRRRFDASDSIMEQVFAAPRFLPEWEAVVEGGCTWPGQTGLGTPEHVLESPSSLCADAEWSPADDAVRTRCVAVERASLTESSIEGYVFVGMGGRIREALERPKRAVKIALFDRARMIASRVAVQTPDPALNSAATLMGFATDGTWGDSTVMHGGWSWRFGYLGWRGWYGTACYGWTDRLKKAIQNIVALGLIKEGEDAGALSSLLDTPGGVFYNMNEVFLDQVRQYFEYTDDLDLMRQIFPVLTGIVAWEGRRLQPEGSHLYESSLNTWISDSHWAIQGQCTQASAYMLRAHSFLADLARRLGEDPEPFLCEAESIFLAMQEKLWMPREGVFAEYRDTRGHRLLHPEPELPTLYHSAEFGAATPLQIDQVLRWVDAHLRSEQTSNQGRLVWSSNWAPNNGRFYTHSTHEMAYAENLNLALMYDSVGRPDEAFDILKATLCGIFGGPTPGGLSCHCTVEGRQRANDEFADAISMWGRAVVEGLFGIQPKRPDGYVLLCPGIPWDWQEASIQSPQLSYRFKRSPGVTEIEWDSLHRGAVHLRLPLRAQEIKEVLVDGRHSGWNIEPGVGCIWARVETPSRRKGSIRVCHVPLEPIPQVRRTVRQGESVELGVPGVPLVGYEDPQDVLAAVSTEGGSLQGVIQAEPGSRVLYAKTGRLGMITPFLLDVLPETPPAPPRIWEPPGAEKKDLSLWDPLDLGPIADTTILEALDKVSNEATLPPAGASRVGFDYWRSHLGSRHHGDPVQTPSDEAWRNKIGPDGIGWTADGIPFKSSKAGPNIAIVTRTGPFSPVLDIPVHTQGKALILMLSGMTFPPQSHVPHLRVTLGYQDNQSESRDLVSPFDIGDCWSTWCGRWHDTAANGFENLGGRFGPAGSIEVSDMTQPIRVDTEAHLVPFDLRPDVPLTSIRLEALAEDIVFGLLGATVLK